MSHPSSFARPGGLGIAVACILFASCADDATRSTSATVEPTSPTTVVTTVAATTASTAPSSTTPTATDPPNPFTDPEIAERLLLDPEEYGEGWQLLQFKPYVLDEQLADSIPACGGFFRSVFQSDQAPNTTAWRYFHAPPGRPAAMGQFVIVFPTESAAMTTFDGMTDPSFEACMKEYFPRTPFMETMYCCDPGIPATPPLLGERVVPGALGVSADFPADGIVFRSDTDQYWTDASGALHGPEVVNSVVIRIGRTISMFEVIMVDEFGVPFVTSEQFQHAIGVAIDRARHALGGVEH